MDDKRVVVVFETAIDPKNTDAYPGLADAYIGLGDDSQAAAILEEGDEYTGIEETGE